MSIKRITEDEDLARTLDPVSDNVRRIADVFPEAIVDGRVNFEVLRQLLGDDIDVSDERYGLSWNGKQQALAIASAPSTATLRPVVEGSAKWGETDNVVIEGDNLEVLKQLQKAYSGRVKLIYIDPPYNTGSDFVYPDDFIDGIGNYLALTGQAAAGGQRLSTSAETSGRLHTNWLNMMYPRLRLARDLLRVDGLLAVSIDDHELPRLLQLLEEVFGPDNVINTITVKSSEASGVKMSHVESRLPKVKEYVVLVARSRAACKLTPIEIEKGKRDPDALDAYLGYYTKIITNPDEPCERWRIVSVRDAMVEAGLDERDPETRRTYQLENANRVVYRTNNAALARVSFDTETAEFVSSTGIHYVWWEGREMLFLADRLKEFVCDLWSDISTINLHRETAGAPLFGSGQKPLALVQRLTTLAGVGPDDLVMDFFAGSGTTGHAVMAQNAADGGNRRYILVQLPEPLDPANKEQKVAAEFCQQLGVPLNIAELTKERLRRAGEQVKADNPDFEGDTGFRVYRLDSSNIREWDPDATDLEGTIDQYIDQIKPDRSDDDLETEVLLKLGIELTTPIATKEIAGKTVSSIGAGALITCFDKAITADDVEALANGIVEWLDELQTAGDTTVVFRDDAFDGDVAKTNLSEMLVQHGVARENVRSL